MIGNEEASGIVQANRLVPVLWVVVPCYNEQDVLPLTVQVLGEKLDQLISANKVSSESKICFVDDGSTDATWTMISQYANQIQGVKGLKLARNYGHQNALLAGLVECRKYADITISIDADLQDDIAVFDQMLEKYTEGCEIVYGVRSDRQTDSAAKRTTAQIFYKLLLALGVEIIFNHADYRLMSRHALNALAQYSEVNLFLRAIIPQIGLRTGVVYYQRLKRAAGVSKYPLSKMVKLALNGITSFSIRPIRLILSAGILFFLIGIVLVIYSIYVRLLSQPTSGWAFLSASLWTLGGIQMMSLGIIGEYIGKIYSETKRRPRYLVESYC
jgi:glycosyltransferase involved in cell wall biosynthesis